MPVCMYSPPKFSLPHSPNLSASCWVFSVWLPCSFPTPCSLSSFLDVSFPPSLSMSLLWCTAGKSILSSFSWTHFFLFHGSLDSHIFLWLFWNPKVDLTCGHPYLLTLAIHFFYFFLPLFIFSPSLTTGMCCCERDHLSPVALNTCLSHALSSILCSFVLFLLVSQLPLLPPSFFCSLTVVLLSQLHPVRNFERGSFWPSSNALVQKLYMNPVIGHLHSRSYNFLHHLVS